MWVEDCLFPSTDHAHPLHKCQKCWGNSCWKDTKSQTKAFRLSCPSSNCFPKASYSHPFWTIIVAGLGPCFFIAGLGPTESVAHSNWGSDQQTGRQMSWSSWWALRDHGEWVPHDHIARHQHQLSKALLSAWSSCRNEENLRHESHASSFPRYGMMIKLTEALLSSWSSWCATHNHGEHSPWLSTHTISINCQLAGFTLPNTFIQPSFLDHHCCWAWPLLFHCWAWPYRICSS